MLSTQEETRSEGTPSSVCAVIVTCNPDIGSLNQALWALKGQVNAILIVDNGSSNDALKWLLAQEKEAHLALLPLGQNTGVAHAQNMGIQWAMSNAFTHVLIMDQDSVPEDTMVSHLKNAMTALESGGFKPGAVGPCCRDSRSGSMATFVQFKDGKLTKSFCRPDEYLPVAWLISSGSLISMKTLRHVGLMEAGLFIDHVDHEWCLRASAKGYGLFAVGNAMLNHQLGDRIVRFWLKRWRRMPSHSPLRHYYMVRNTILLLGRDYISPDCKAFLRRHLAFIICVHLVVAPPRYQHFLKMAKGVIDGLRNVTGTYQGGWAEKNDK